VLCGRAVTVMAQSLADVARQEEARRKEIKTPGKAYTNKDLGEVPLPSTPPPLPSEESKDGQESKDAKENTPSAGSSPAAVAQDGNKDAKEPPVKKDQAYWSGRMKTASTQLERDQTFADALQSRINALTADFSGRSDPAQRELIGRDRQKALGELDRLKKTIQSDKKALADLQDEARRAGVPPGWLR